MTKLHRLVVFLAVAAMASLPLSSGGTEVVVNREVLMASVHRKTIRSIFLGTVKRWDNGRQIVLVVLPFDHPATKSFAWEVLHVTPYTFEDKIGGLSSSDTPPIVVYSEQEMLRTVASTPNSVGYITSMIVVNSAGNKLRVIPVL